MSTAPVPDESIVEHRVSLALAMLGRGAWVFPLARDSKKPLVPKAAGGEGFKDARPDPEMAATFLRNAGQPNYGVVFPEGSEIFVLDLDGGGDSPRPEWREDWQRLYERYGPPGLTFIVKTPSGGRHAYYRWRTDLYGPLPPGDEMLGWTVRKPWKGYLVGPGSVVNGVAYEPAGLDAIADFPEAWSRAAVGEAGQPAAPGAGRAIVTGPRGPATVQTGHRHAYLRNQARHLVGLGLTGEALFTAVMDLNRQLPQPKTAEDVRRAIGEAETLFEPDEVSEDGIRVPAVADEELGLLGLTTVGGFPAAPERAAFGGLIGECVENIAPGTDASAVGLLGSLVAFCGALVPGSAYFHRIQTTSPFIALVGESSVGRKGTAMMRARDAVASAIEPVYVNRVVLDGLNSGEGLISALHYKREAFPHEPVVGLVLEEEYAGLLAARQRDGSTLDPKMRAAFDGGPLSNRRSGETKTVLPPYWLPALIAITPDELRARLEGGALRSGSANRWLYLAVVKRDVTPTNEEPVLRADLARRLVAARRAALDSPRPLAVDRQVTATLAEYADYLPGVSHGVSHELVRRLGVIAFRVALVHALVDGSATVTVDHLERALALTEYARAGIPWVFGETIGSPDADLLLRNLVVSGRLTKNNITREIIRDPLRRQAAIDELVRYGRAEVVTVHPERGGRARTELVATTETAEFRPFRPNIQTSASRNHENVDVLDETPDLSTNGLGRNVDETWTNDGRNDLVSVVCDDYSAHQNYHRLVNERWVCDLCSGRNVDETPDVES